MLGDIDVAGDACGPRAVAGHGHTRAENWDAITRARGEFLAQERNTLPEQWAGSADPVRQTMQQAHDGRATCILTAARIGAGQRSEQFFAREGVG
jgi:hypothetical protein